MEIDVALVPREARAWPPAVCIVIDELRASSTLTALLELGCATVFVTAGLQEARHLARQRGAILAGERGGRTPAGFDADNSPSQLARLDVRRRPVVLSTSNGTRALRAVRAMPAVLVGCLNNAGACAGAALALAAARDLPIGVVCAGIDGRFALDDAVAAGQIVDRILATGRAAGIPVEARDAALGAAALRLAYPDPARALEASSTGRLVRRIGAADDIAWCARLDATDAVPILCDGPPMHVERLEPLPVPTASPG